MKLLKNHLERNGSMDMLRTLAIVFVICHHIVVYTFGIIGLKDGTINLSSYQTYISEFLNCFFVIGVNLFFLLSGYFGIKLKKGKILSILCKVYFYFLCAGLIEFAVGSKSFSSIWEAIKYFLAARNNYWFINAYIVLFFLAPLLNILAENLNLRQVFYFVTVTFASLGMVGGYSPIWGSIVYLYGRIIKLNENKLKNNKSFWLCGYFLFSIVNFLCVLLLSSVLKLGNRAWQMYNYNNPLVLGSSVCLLMTFANLKIKNTNVNAVFSMFAKHSLGVYIIHTIIPYSFLIDLVNTYWVRVSLFLPNMLIVFLGCSLVDALYDCSLGKLFYKFCCIIESIFIKIYGLCMRFGKKVFLKKQQ